MARSIPTIHERHDVPVQPPHADALRGPVVGALQRCAEGGHVPLDRSQRDRFEVGVPSPVRACEDVGGRRVTVDRLHLDARNA